MGKEKSSMTKSTTKHPSSETKKTSNKKQNHLEDIDSLSCFKQKKTQDIDDKFNLLKSELQSLFYNPKAETSKSELRTQTVAKTDILKEKDESTVKSNSSKFSEWLSETIDKIEVKPKDSSSNEDIDSNTSLSSTLKSKYNMTLIPKYKVERLLYKSFQLKNLNIYVLSSSDESEVEQLKSFRGRKQKRTKRRSARAVSAFPKRSLKRKRASVNNEVEVINLDSTLKDDEPKIIDYVDLVSYDWSEPFNTNSVSGDTSDLEIIDSDEDLNVQKQSDAEAEQKQSDSNACTQEQNSNNNFTSPNGKRAWECPICFESSQGQTIVATHCGHIFCKKCLEQHNATKGKNCPTCRFDLTGKTPITLFNL